LSRIKNQAVKRGRIETKTLDEAGVFDYPVFSFQKLRVSDYGIDECNQEQRASLALKLAKIGTLSWQEAHQTPKHGLGCEKIPKKAIKYKIDNEFERIEFYLAFRFYTCAAMVGYRCKRGAFHILWLDRNFELYNHG
jgi:hypothetical protein